MSAETSIVEFTGPEQVIAANESLITQSVGAVVLRGALGTAAAERLYKVGMAWMKNGSVDPYNQRGYYDQDAVQAVLYTEVPRLEEVDSLIADWWDISGYEDYALREQRFRPENRPRIRGSLGIHIDAQNIRNPDGTLREQSSFLYGPVTGTVCSRGQVRLFARRVPLNQRDHEGNFSYANFCRVVEATTKRRNLLQRIGARSLQPVLLEPGDIAFFLQHPFNTEHAV